MSVEHPTVDEIARSVVDCRTCPRLIEWCRHVGTEKRAAFATETYWAKPVPGLGDPEASVVVVGLAPAAHGANRTGRMFTGDRSGDFLFASLHRTGFANQAISTDCDDGLELRDIYITSAVKCAPPANRPTTAEEAACARWLIAELTALHSAPVVVALGGLAFNRILRLGSDLGWKVGSPRPRFAHAAEVAVAHGPTVIGCYHPSQQNTFTGRLQPVMIDHVFDRARHLARLE